MGNAKAWWYPDPTGTLEALDFGQGLTETEHLEDVLDDTTESIEGGEYRTTLRRRTRVRIVLSRFPDGQVRRKMHAFVSHCERGGLFGFAEDSALAFASFIRAGSAPVRGDTSIQFGPQPWAYDGSAITMSAGDEVVLASHSPERQWETLLIGTHTSNQSTLNASYPVLNTYSASPTPILVRHRGFWPLLRVPRGGASGMLTDDHRLTYSLDFTAIEAVEFYPAFVDQSGGPKGVAASSLPTTIETIQGWLAATYGPGYSLGGQAPGGIQFGVGL